MMLNTTNTISTFQAHHEAAQIERKARYKMEIVERFPDIHTIQERVYWGVFSWSLTKSKIRLVKRKALVDIGAGYCTIGDVARDYLDFFYPKRQRATANQKAAICMHRSAPLYLRQGGSNDLSYVDLSSAYFNIMLRFGWDVDYFPGRWIVKGRPPHDFPIRDNKVSRNILVSSGISTHNIVWTGYKFTRISAKNAHINFGLWSLIQDILHIIAGVAVECGAYYVHTDGYILPTKNAAPLIGVIHELKLKYKIKARGSGWVWGFGNFKVGDHETKFLRPINRPKPYRGIRFLSAE